MTGYDDDSDSETKPRRGLAYVILAAGLLIALGLALGLGFGLRSLKDDPSVVMETTPPTTTPSPPPEPRTEEYRFAAVTSDAKQCSEIGTRVLARGGSAVDSAIATVVCMGIFNPSNGGLGGGFFMTYYDRQSQTADTLDAREVAPKAANESLYVGKDRSASLTGGLAVGVPGQVAGLWAAHQKYGKLPFKDLLEPSIKFCREGVPMAKPLAYAVSRTEAILRNNSFGFYFDPDTKEPYTTGHMVKYPKMADTLEKVANNGSYVFYEGELSDIIVQEIQDNGGIITKEDLKEYEPLWQDPTTFTLRDGHKVYSMPPPGSGPVLEYMLNIIDGYNFTKDSVSTNKESILSFHRAIEAMKFAFAKRTELGDDEFEDVAQLVQNMTSVEYGNSIRDMINDTHTQDVEFYNPSYYTRPDAGTSQVSIVDAMGNAVSITSTINYFFGAKVRGNTTGIMYNNEMDDFSTPGVVNVYGVSPSPRNFIKPGKRPMSSMCPSIIVDGSGDVVMVIGGSGGTRITTGTFLVILHTMMFGLEAKEAVAYKRLHHQLLPNLLQVQEGFPKAIGDGLKARGHNFTDYTNAGNINLVYVKEGTRYAVCDVPKDGTPDGY